MKKILLSMLFLIAQSAYAACTVVPSSSVFNFGTYNSANGGQVSGSLIVSNCNASVTTSLQVLVANNQSITNGVSNLNYKFYNTSNTQFCTDCAAGSFLLPPFPGISGFQVDFVIKLPPGQTGLNPGSYAGSFIIQAVNGTTTLTTLTVNAAVAGACTLSSAGIQFNTVSLTADTTKTGTVTSTCTSGTSYTLSADAGASGSIANRTLKNGLNSLNYNLYTTSNYSTVWGNGTTGSTIPLTANGSSQSSTIYGKVPMGQYPVPGNYSDTLNITLTY